MAGGGRSNPDTRMGELVTSGSGEWPKERSNDEQLSATVARLKAVLEQMPSAVAMVEAPSGRLVLSNEKAE